jgi:hypothetical protein
LVRVKHSLDIPSPSFQVAIFHERISAMSPLLTMVKLPNVLVAVAVPNLREAATDRLKASSYGQIDRVLGEGKC